MKENTYNDDDDDNEVLDINGLIKRVQEMPLTPSTSMEFHAMTKSALSSFKSSADRYMDSYNQVHKQVIEFEQKPEHKKYFKEGEHLPFSYVKNLKDEIILMASIKDLFATKAIFINEVRIKYTKGYNSLKSSEIMTESLKQQKDLFKMQMDMIEKTMSNFVATSKEFMSENREFSKKLVFDYGNVVSAALDNNTLVLKQLLNEKTKMIEYKPPVVDKPHFTEQKNVYNNPVYDREELPPQNIKPVTATMVDKLDKKKKTLDIPDLSSLEAEQELEDDGSDFQSEGDDIDEE